ncbi:hypothetical protein [Nitrospira sp. Nam80]
MTDIPALKLALRPLLGDRPRSFRGRPVVLVLPDLCIRVTLLDMQTLPKEAAALTRLVRWRLEKEALFPMAGTKITVQVVGPRTVMVVAIRDAVLQPYETLCDELGLIPVEVDIASFRLCNLFAPFLSTKEPVVWVSLLDGATTVMILEGGRPVLCRIKPQGNVGQGDVLQDLARSLAYYANVKPNAAPRRVVCLTEVQDADVTAKIAEKFAVESIDLRTQCYAWLPRWVEGSAATESLTALAGVLG